MILSKICLKSSVSYPHTHRLIHLSTLIYEVFCSRRQLIQRLTTHQHAVLWLWSSRLCMGHLLQPFLPQGLGTTGGDGGVEIVRVRGSQCLQWPAVCQTWQCSCTYERPRLWFHAQDQASPILRMDEGGSHLSYLRSYWQLMALVGGERD